MNVQLRIERQQAIILDVRIEVQDVALIAKRVELAGEPEHEGFRAARVQRLGNEENSHEELHWTIERSRRP